MKKLLILMFAIFFISMVSAVPPQSNTGVHGINIEYPQYEFAKANTSFDLHTHAFNISTGLMLTNTTTDCYIHLYSPTGSHIYNQEMNFSTNGFDFEAEIPATTFTMLGTNAYILQCNSSVVGGFASGSFTVTNSGYHLEDHMVSALWMFIILLFLIGAGFFVGFLKSDKIQIKWSMFIIGFLFFLTALNTIGVFVYDSLVSSAIVSFVDTFTSISFIVFWFSFTLLGIIWFLTMLRAILFRKSMKQAAKFGGMME